MKYTCTSRCLGLTYVLSGEIKVMRLLPLTDIQSPQLFSLSWAVPRGIENWEHSMQCALVSVPLSFYSTSTTYSQSQSQDWIRCWTWPRYFSNGSRSTAAPTHGVHKIPPKANDTNRFASKLSLSCLICDRRQIRDSVHCATYSSQTYSATCVCMHSEIFIFLWTRDEIYLPIYIYLL